MSNYTEEQVNPDVITHEHKHAYLYILISLSNCGISEYSEITQSS